MFVTIQYFGLTIIIFPQKFLKHILEIVSQKVINTFLNFNMVRFGSENG